MLEVQTSTTLREKLEIFNKNNICIYPAVLFLDLSRKCIFTNTKRHVHKVILRGIFVIGKEITRNYPMPILNRPVEWTKVHPHKGVLCSQKQWVGALWTDMTPFLGYVIKWKKQDAKECMLYIYHLCIEEAGEIRIFFVEIYTHVYTEEGKTRN